MIDLATISGTIFQKKGSTALLAIPAGQTRTYTEIAESIGCPGYARVVANACGANRHAPEIPCHRAVAKAGIGGYSADGGIQRKKQLLEEEGVRDYR